jgi:hypothetical protein
MLFLEDFGVPVPGEIGAVVLVVAIVIAHRVRRGRAERTA